MTVDKLPNGHITVKLERDDWNRGGHSFGAVLKEAIPASYYDGKLQSWIVPEIQSERLVKLVRIHFGYRIERLVS